MIKKQKPGRGRGKRGHEGKKEIEKRSVDGSGDLTFRKARTEKYEEKGGKKIKTGGKSQRRGFEKNSWWGVILGVQGKKKGGWEDGEDPPQKRRGTRKRKKSEGEGPGDRVERGREKS